MIRLFLSLTYQQYTELKEHFHSNGYHVIWETYDVITVDEDIKKVWNRFVLS